MDIKELYKIFCEHPVITTDTRDCPEGSIFFALKGASFNGNDFALQALEQGCSYAVVEAPPCLPQGEEIYMGGAIINFQFSIDTAFAV